MKETKKTSKQMLKDITAKSYEDARQAKQNGGLVCWASSVAPIEICEAMDIKVIYPENHAAAEGAKGGSLDLINAAERLGYSSDNCSYARVNFGYLDIQEAVGEEIPLPDLLFVCPNICHTVIKWYENIAYQLKIPMILIDTPYNHGEKVTPENVAYVKACLVDAISTLEELTGRPFDYNKLEEVMRYSNESITKWLKALDYAKYVPTPVNGFNFLNYMAAIVIARGTKECVACMDLWLDELEANHQAGIPAFKEGEKFRIMWDGLACWAQLRYTYQTMRNLGVILVASNYPANWNQQFTPGSLDELAYAYTSMIVNTNPINQIRSRSNTIRASQADGVVYHLNRSCKLTSVILPEIAKRIYEETGVPYTMFDGDQTDPRVLSEANFETHIQALTEVMAENKAQGKGGVPNG